MSRNISNLFSTQEEFIFVYLCCYFDASRWFFKCCSVIFFVFSKTILAIVHGPLHLHGLFTVILCNLVVEAISMLLNSAPLIEDVPTTAVQINAKFVGTATSSQIWREMLLKSRSCCSGTAEASITMLRRYISIKLIRSLIMCYL